MITSIVIAALGLGSAVAGLVKRRRARKAAKVLDLAYSVVKSFKR